MNCKKHGYKPRIKDSRKAQQREHLRLVSPVYKTAQIISESRSSDVSKGSQ
jgi:hypothetical protein